MQVLTIKISSCTKIATRCVYFRFRTGGLIESSAAAICLHSVGLVPVSTAISWKGSQPLANSAAKCKCLYHLLHLTDGHTENEHSHEVGLG
jgi:hypothetical protein